MELNKRIFNSVEDIKEAYGFDVIVPHVLDCDANIICYTTDIEEPFHYYKQGSDGEVYSKESFGWYLCSPSLESLVASDTEMFDSIFIYLHLTQQEKKEKFTPKRLLGVETDKGYVTDVHFTKDFEPQIVTVQICNKHLYHPCSLRYYISDDSDETVPFDEYVDMFYERE